jgi:hypothetical protein
MGSMIRAAVLIGLVLLAIACGPTAPLELETIQLGRSINPDGSVGLHTTSFRPADTIYVAVLTKAAGAGTIGVRWKYGSNLVGEPEKKVSYREPRATEFHLTNSGGFPPGEYSVEAFIDGRSVGVRAFKVDAAR